jgi:cytochrome c-type biogenesis protein CcmH/NrfG
VATDTETVGETSSVVDLKRVEILLDLRRYDEALTEANRCAATSPGDPRPLLLVARAELGLGHPKRAQQAAETAIGFAPDSAAAFRLQAIALTVQARQLGRPGSRPRSYLSERALQAARQSIALEPQEPAGYWAFTDAAVVDRRLREAIAASGDAVRLAPDHPTSWLMRARVARHARDVRAAEAACREALRLDPQHYPANNELGIILRMSNRGGQSRTQFLSTAALDPTLSVAPQNLRRQGASILLFVMLVPLVPLGLFAGPWVLAGAAAIVAVLALPPSRRRFDAWSLQLAVWLGRRRAAGSRRPRLPRLPGAGARPRWRRPVRPDSPIHLRGQLGTGVLALAAVVLGGVGLTATVFAVVAPGPSGPASELTIALPFDLVGLGCAVAMRRRRRTPPHAPTLGYLRQAATRND